MDTEPLCSVWQCPTPRDGVILVAVTPDGPIGADHTVRIPACKGCRHRYAIPLARGE